MADPVSLAINAALIAANMAMQASQEIEGPRLESLEATTASYGTPLLYSYGTRRLEGCPVFFAEPLREVKRKRKTKGGKYNEYSYFGTWAVLVVDHPAEAVTRIWFDKHLVYDATGAGPLTPLIGAEGLLVGLGMYIVTGSFTTSGRGIRIYLGAADQQPDPRMSATVDAEHGTGSTPAYRGVTYLMFEDIPLEKFGNRLPQVSVEVVANATPAFPYSTEPDPTDTFGRPRAIGYSPDRTRFGWVGLNNAYGIVDMGARAVMVTGTLDDSEGDVTAGETVGVASDGTIYAVTDVFASAWGQLTAFPPDGLGLATGLVSLAAGSTELSGASVQVLEAGGYEIVCAYSASKYAHIYPIHDPDSYQQINTADYFSGGFTPTGYFTDTYGDLWCVGAPFNGGNVIRFLRIYSYGDSPCATNHFEVPADVSLSGVCNVGGFHFQDSEVDHFIVAVNGNSGDRLIAVDLATQTVSYSVAAAVSSDLLKQMNSVTPGAGSFWIGTSSPTEYSSRDLSVIRTIDPNDWVSDGLGFAVYDPINHAIMGAYSTLGQTGVDPITWRYLDRQTGNGVTLQSIVENVAERCGLDVADISATALNQVVPGYSWTQGTGKAILEPLLEAYNSEARPHDFQLQFQKRSGSPSGDTIATAQMGAGGGTRYEITRTLDTDLPAAIDFTFADINSDQQPNTAHAKRPAAVTDSARRLSLDLTTLALTPDQARVMAEQYLRRKWLQNETYKLSLTRGFSALEPGDVKTLALDDMSRVASLRRLEFGANGVLTCDWLRDGVAVHVETTLTGAPSDGHVPPVMLSAAASKGFVLDIPLVQDSHDALMMYVAAGPYDDAVAWPGATLWKSDDGVDFEEELTDVSSSQRATWGYTSGALADALPEVWDRKSTVTVIVKSGELTSATEAEVANGANLALIGDELVGFTTATLTAADTYQLSGFLRGRRGTEQHTGSHASGERFVLMTGSTVRLAMGASDVGIEAHYKAITIGGTSGFAQALTYTGASLKPYSPAHMKATASGGDTIVTAVRRTRIGGAWRDGADAALGEGSEAYVGQILNGSGAVIRTYSGLTSPTFTYTAAEKTADSGAGVTARLMQVSTTVGNGYPADVAI